MADFFKGPGKTKLKSGDLVVTLSLPIPPGWFIGKYIKLNRNKRGDLAIVGVTAASWPDQSASTGLKVKIALASVAPVPLVVPTVEEFFDQNGLTMTRSAGSPDRHGFVHPDR